MLTFIVVCDRILVRKRCEINMSNVSISLSSIAVGKRLKEFRIEKNMKIQKMATRAGVDPKHLKRIEDGESEASMIILFRLMKGIDKGLTDLFDERYEDIYHDMLNKEINLCE